MAYKFSAQLQIQLVETLCQVFYYKNALRQFLRRMNIPAPILHKFERELQGNSKRPVLNQLIEELIALPDAQGVESLNRMLGELRVWKTFNASANPDEAKTAVEKLAALIEADEGKRTREKEDKERREREFLVRQQAGNRLRQQENLRSQYYDFFRASNPHQRGLAFQKLLQGVFSLENLNPTEPFSLKGEQIDGGFEFEGTHYLVESKWVQEKTAPDDVAWFKLKVERKLIGTRGLMIAVNGFTEEAIRTASDSKIIILMDGDDLMNVLETSNELTFSGLLRHKIAEFARRGRSFVTARELLDRD